MSPTFDRPATQALVLVGGKGTRLGVLAADTPKPLMPIDGNNVFLDELLFNLARHGFEEILLLAGHLHEVVSARYHGRRIYESEIEVLVEPTPAGTGGALEIAKARLAPTFMLANGDTLFDVNLRRLDQVLELAPDALAALALRHVPNAARYGEVELRGGRIVSFREKKQLDAAGLINAGVGLYRRDVISFVDRMPCSIEVDIYPRLAAAGRLVGEAFDGFFIDIGLPETLAQAQEELPRRRRRPALFLDRDGVLNHDSGYTHRVEDLRWIDGAIETIRRANELGVLTIVVTNQAGVAKGYYGLQEVALFQDAMLVELAAFGAHIDAFYVCPDHPDAIVPEFRREDSPDRKPNPGMILKALRDWPIDISRSALIGDRAIDIEAARRAGVPGILFEGGNLLTVAEPILKRIKEPARTREQIE